jgi:hypothetical protein
VDVEEQEFRGECEGGDVRFAQLGDSILQCHPNIHFRNRFRAEHGSRPGGLSGVPDQACNFPSAARLAVKNHDVFVVNPP